MSVVRLFHRYLPQHIIQYSFKLNSGITDLKNKKLYNIVYPVTPSPCGLSSTCQRGTEPRT